MSMLIDAYRFGGGGGGGFPTYVEHVTSSRSTATTSHSVPLPATVDAGDKLIIVYQQRGTSTVTVPSGWTTKTEVGVNSMRQVIVEKTAAGTEGGTSVTFTSGSMIRSTSIVYRIAAGSYSGSCQVLQIAPNPTTANPIPPPLSPAWGAADTLWIAGFGATDNGSVSVYPYPDNNVHRRCDPVLTGTPYNEIASCSVEQNTATLTPGSFTRSLNTNVITYTIAIQPP